MKKLKLKEFLSWLHPDNHDMRKLRKNPTITFCTGPTTDLEVLSVYTDDKGNVCVDMESR
jgi:hypothetical protein